MKITKAQSEALFRVYTRDKTVAPSFLAFRRQAYIGLFLTPDAPVCFIQWKGMQLGIEPDGYTHS